MNVVQPIRDYEKLEALKRVLKAKNERDYVLLMMGLYTALRISDILRIRVEDIAYCFLRGSRRTFKVNNLLAVVPVKERAVV